MVPAIICAVAADSVQPRWPWPVLKNTPGIRPARTTGIMFGIIGRNPAQDVTLLQDAANLEWIVQGGRAHKQPEPSRPAERQPA